MKLVSLEVSGFRGFPQRHRFDLDADAIVVVGANGHGKTSIFDGILWALSGRIPRLMNDDTRLVSMYSEAGQARVALQLKEPTTGGHVTVTRSFDGNEARVALETKEGAYEGPAAEGRLIELVWPDAASASDPHEALASVLTRSVFLQQDLIRQFVEAASDQERFAAVSELVGAGRVTDLQANLERAKRAWSTATNQRQGELNPLRQRLALIEARTSELTTRASLAATAITPGAWRQWWEGIAAFGLTSVLVEPSSREAPAAIDNAIRQLDVSRRSIERRLQALRLLETDIAQQAGRALANVRALRRRVTVLRKERETLKRLVAEEQTRLTDARHLQAELQEKNEQLRTLATLALKHLGNHCPVCAQTYDREATRSRLEGLVEGGINESVTESSPAKLTELVNDLGAKETEVANAELALRSAEQAATEQDLAEQTLSRRLTDLQIVGIDEASRTAPVTQAIVEAEASLRQLAEMQRVGESLALRIAQSSAVAAIDELSAEAGTLRREVADREKIIAARNKTGERAQHVIEALREAASAVVQERLREIGPLFQSIYGRIDPHPAFRLVTFLARIFRGKGLLSTVVSDPIVAKECDLPAAVLSSSQVNALAVSVFLALNIGVRRPPLSVAILDDPLQSLDDINLLGLVDLLRRTKERRQLFVSTHDAHFGSLLSRKLRPRNENGRTIVIELDGWSRQGPIVSTRDVKCDPVPLRLVPRKVA